MRFFENLSKKASQTYKNTAEKTNKLTSELKLKSLINEDKDKIEEIYAEIGKKVYEKHIREENIDIRSELAEECSKIDAYSKEIEDMNTEIRALKNLRLCKTCASEISLDCKFCPKCGALQEETKPTKCNEINEETNIVADKNSNIETVSGEISSSNEQQTLEESVTKVLVDDDENIELDNNQ